MPLVMQVVLALLVPPVLEWLYFSALVNILAFLIRSVYDTTIYCIDLLFNAVWDVVLFLIFTTVSLAFVTYMFIRWAFLGKAKSSQVQKALMIWYTRSGLPTKTLARQSSIVPQIILVPQNVNHADEEELTTDQSVWPTAKQGTTPIAPQK
jgi:hypothetical protein